MNINDNINEIAVVKHLISKGHNFIISEMPDGRYEVSVKIKYSNGVTICDMAEGVTNENYIESVQRLCRRHINSNNNEPGAEKIIFDE